VDFFSYFNGSTALRSLTPSPLLNQVFSRQRRQKLVFLPEGFGALTTVVSSS
jgi:hypothetical protein